MSQHRASTRILGLTLSMPLGNVCVADRLRVIGSANQTIPKSARGNWPRKSGPSEEVLRGGPDGCRQGWDRAIINLKLRKHSRGKNEQRMTYEPCLKTTANLGAYFVNFDTNNRPVWIVNSLLVVRHQARKVIAPLYVLYGDLQSIIGPSRYP